MVSSMQKWVNRTYPFSLKIFSLAIALTLFSGCSGETNRYGGGTIGSNPPARSLIVEMKNVRNEIVTNQEVELLETAEIKTTNTEGFSTFDLQELSLESVTLRVLDSFITVSLKKLDQNQNVRAEIIIDGDKAYLASDTQEEAQVSESEDPLIGGGLTSNSNLKDNNNKYEPEFSPPSTSEAQPYRSVGFAIEVEQGNVEDLELNGEFLRNINTSYDALTNSFYAYAKLDFSESKRRKERFSATLFTATAVVSIKLPIKRNFSEKGMLLAKIVFNAQTGEFSLSREDSSGGNLSDIPRIPKTGDRVVSVKEPKAVDKEAKNQIDNLDDPFLKQQEQSNKSTYR